MDNETCRSVEESKNDLKTERQIASDLVIMTFFTHLIMDGAMCFYVLTMSLE